MRWLLIVTLVASLVSCSRSSLVDGPVLTSPPLTGQGGMEAKVWGAVLFNENTGCLYLERDNRRYPVVWPAGASWQADPRAVKLQGQLIEPGMYVDGGGGYLKYEHVKALAGTAVANAAQACASPTGEIAFFNSGSDVRVVSN